jgi:hypothetical protein
MNNNILIEELEGTVNKWSKAIFGVMGGVAVVDIILVATRLVPVYSLLIIAGYVPVSVLILILMNDNRQKLNTLSKKIQISTAACKAKDVMNTLVKSYSYSDASNNSKASKEKMQYLSDNGVDITSALKQVNSNIEKYNKLAADFINECTVLEDDMYTLMQKKSLSEYATKARELRLKSNALGFRNLTDTAFFHELEACTGNLEILETNWQKLSFELDESSALLEEYIKSLSDNAQFSRKAWVERLQEAFNALEVLDTDTAKEIFIELMENPLNPDVAAVLKNIIASIDEIVVKS